MVSNIRSPGQPFQMLLPVLSGHSFSMHAFGSIYSRTSAHWWMKDKKATLALQSVSIVYNTWETFPYLNTAKLALIQVPAISHMITSVRCIGQNSCLNENLNEPVHIQKGLQQPRQQGLYILLVSSLYCPSPEPSIQNETRKI